MYMGFVEENTRLRVQRKRKFILNISLINTISTEVCEFATTRLHSDGYDIAIFYTFLYCTKLCDQCCGTYFVGNVSQGSTNSHLSTKLPGKLAGPVSGRKKTKTEPSKITIKVQRRAKTL